jgi:hypothetical protein
VDDLPGYGRANASASEKSSVPLARYSPLNGLATSRGRKFVGASAGVSYLWGGQGVIDWTI